MNQSIRCFPLFGFLCFALIACDEKGTGPATGPDAFLSGLKPGDSRLLLKELKAQGRTYGYDLYSLAEIRIDKDTVIEGAPAKEFTITATELMPDSSHVYVERNYLVAQGDSLNLYRDKEGNSGFLFGLTKRSAYDTTRFSDRTTEWIFPLVAGATWRTRPEGGKGWSLKKEWTGKENLAFDGRDVACDVFVLHSVVDLKSWIASFGLVKAEIAYGPDVFTDSLGNDVDTAQAEFERYELLKLNPTPTGVADAKSKFRALSWSKMPATGR